MAQWSRGMILALGARGPGFKSRLSPIFSCYTYSQADAYQTMAHMKIKENIVNKMGQILTSYSRILTSFERNQAKISSIYQILFSSKFCVK